MNEWRKICDRVWRIGPLENSGVLVFAGNRWHMNHSSFPGGYMGCAATLPEAKREVEDFHAAEMRREKARRS